MDNRCFHNCYFSFWEVWWAELLNLLLLNFKVGSVEEVTEEEQIGGIH